MRHLFALVAALLVLISFGANVAAQDATPAAGEGGAPAGVTFEPIAQAVVDQLPPAPADVFFLRLTLAPGASFPLNPADPSLVLVGVESGTFSVRALTEVQVARVVIAGTPVAAEVVAEGVEFTLSPGESAIFPPFVAGEVRNDGQEPAVALVAGIEPIGALATPAAATPVAAGTPVGEAEEFAPLAGVVFQPLAFGSVEVLPLGPAGIGIGRLTLEPGAVIPPHPHLGPEFGVIEAGTASITVSEGELQVARGVATMATPFAEPAVETFGAGDEVTLNPGDAVFYESGTVADLRNAGDQSLVFLGGGIEPIGVAPATPEAATPVS